MRESLDQHPEKGSEHVGTEETMGQCPGIQDRAFSGGSDRLNQACPRSQRKAICPGRQGDESSFNKHSLVIYLHHTGPFAGCWRLQRSGTIPAFTVKPGDIIKELTAQNQVKGHDKGHICWGSPAGSD